MARKLTASGLSRAITLLACSRDLLLVTISSLPPSQHGLLLSCANLLANEADRFTLLRGGIAPIAPDDVESRESRDAHAIVSE